jgi:hypothetical protein
MGSSAIGKKIHFRFFKCLNSETENSCFVFEWSRVQMSARRPVIPAEVFVVFVSPSKVVPGYNLKIKQQLFYSK